MTTSRVAVWRWFGIFVLTAVALSMSFNVANAQTETQVEVYATGLINPKGIAFGDDGTLYVAESGPPSEVMVPLPAAFGGEGPIGTGGRVSRIPPGGERQDFITDLPNIGLYSGVEMLGAASVAVLDGQLYEVAAGHMTVSPKLSLVSADGQLATIADIGEFNDAHPPPPSNGDAIPMGNPFDLVGLDGNLYITDGNYNRVLRATPEGELSILVAWEKSPVTVGVAAGPDGALYVCQFSPEPYTMGTGRVDRVEPDGTVTEGVITDLTTPIDIAFAPDGTPYILQFAAEFSSELRRYIPFGGEVQRVNDDGTTTPVVTNLIFPTSMTFGPDGALYVTNYGNEANNGEGQVLRVIPGDDDVAYEQPATPEPLPTVEEQPTATPIPEGELPDIVMINIVEPQDPSEWGYDPSEVTIQVGQTVVFTNTGRVRHTATDSSGAFDTGLLSTDQSSEITFDNPGTFNYFCTPHPWMQGVIIVEGEVSADGGIVGSFEDLDPPAVKAWQVVLFVGLIVGAVLVAGFFTRRRTDESDPEPTATDTE